MVHILGIMVYIIVYIMVHTERQTDKETDRQKKRVFSLKVLTLDSNRQI